MPLRKTASHAIGANSTAIQQPGVRKKNQMAGAVKAQALRRRLISRIRPGAPAARRNTMGQQETMRVEPLPSQGGRTAKMQECRRWLALIRQLERSLPYGSSHRSTTQALRTDANTLVAATGGDAYALEIGTKLSTSDPGHFGTDTTQVFGLTAGFDRISNLGLFAAHFAFTCHDCLSKPSRSNDEFRRAPSSGCPGDYYAGSAVAWGAPVTSSRKS